MNVTLHVMSLNDDAWYSVVPDGLASGASYLLRTSIGSMPI